MCGRGAGTSAKDDAKEWITVLKFESFCRCGRDFKRMVTRKDGSVQTHNLIKWSMPEVEQHGEKKNYIKVGIKYLWWESNKYKGYNIGLS